MESCAGTLINLKNEFDSKGGPVKITAVPCRANSK